MKDTMFIIYVDSEMEVFNLAETTEKGREYYSDKDRDDDGFWDEWSEDLNLDELLQILRDRLEP